MIVKVTRRYSAGLLVDASYVLSKMFHRRRHRLGQYQPRRASLNFHAK